MFRARLRSANNAEHLGALDELFVSERMAENYRVAYEEGGEGPDFRAYTGDEYIAGVEVLSIFMRQDWSSEAQRHGRLTDELNSRVVAIPVTFFVMDPIVTPDANAIGWSRSRQRWRTRVGICGRFFARCMPLLNAWRRRRSPSAGMRVYTYNFLAPFRSRRLTAHVGHAVWAWQARHRSPILVFDEGTPYWDYFASQLEWMQRLADAPREPWTSRGLVVRALEDRDLSIVERDLAIT
jgi:hypothetical protein